MSDGTKIQWTDASWNPLRASVNDGPGVGWACVRVSQGCVNCYAATINKRLGTGLDYTVPALAKVATYIDVKALAKPTSWRKPRRIFVCSMSDLFGEWVGDDEINAVWAVMLGATRHTFQVLTKRPERMRAWVTRYQYGKETARNIWLGTSVEDQRAADERIPHLLATPAAVRFLSCEPLLGPIAISQQLKPRYSPMTNVDWPANPPKIDWVIVGGESGPRARPMDLAWARSLRDQCVAADVSVFVKQLGSRPMYDAQAGGEFTAMRDWPHHDSHSGDPAEWPADLRVRDWPANTRLEKHGE